MNAVDQTLEGKTFENPLDRVEAEKKMETMLRALGLDETAEFVGPGERIELPVVLGPDGRVRSDKPIEFVRVVDGALTEIPAIVAK